MRAARPNKSETVTDLHESLKKDLPGYDHALIKFESVLEKSTEQFAGMLEDANKQLQQSVVQAKQEMEEQILRSQEAFNGQTEEKIKKVVPESTWVKDHLVLNRPAVELLNAMFDQFQSVIQELVKSEPQ